MSTPTSNLPAPDPLDTLIGSLPTTGAHFDTPSRGGQWGAPRSYGGHTGVDFPWSAGTGVGVPQPGRVRFAGWRGGYGNRVEVEHPDGTVTTYSHLSKIQVRQGDDVDEGSLVGNVGNTGGDYPTHLHYEVLQGGHKVNPLGTNLVPVKGAGAVKYQQGDPLDKLISTLPQTKPTPETSDPLDSLISNLPDSPALAPPSQGEAVAAPTLPSRGTTNSPATFNGIRSGARGSNTVARKGVPRVSNPDVDLSTLPQVDANGQTLPSQQEQTAQTARMLGATVTGQASSSLPNQPADVPDEVTARYGPIFKPRPNVLNTQEPPAPLTEAQNTEAEQYAQAGLKTPYVSGTTGRPLVTGSLESMGHGADVLSGAFKTYQDVINLLPKQYADQLSGLVANASQVGMTPGQISDLITDRAKVTQAAIQKANEQRPMSKAQTATAFLTSLVGDLAQIGLLSDVVGPEAAFAGQGYLGARGQGVGVGRSLVEGGKGLATAELFGATEAQPVLTRLPTVAAGSYGLEKATGASDEEALSRAAMNTAFSAAPTIAEGARVIANPRAAIQRGIETRLRSDQPTESVPYRPGVSPTASSGGRAVEEGGAEVSGEPINPPETEAPPQKQSHELQPRRKINVPSGTKGQFRKETGSEREARRAQVAQSDIPAKNIPSEQPESGTSQPGNVQPESETAKAYSENWLDYSPEEREANTREVDRQEQAKRETENVEPVPEGHTRFYRADSADATKPQGAGWARDPEYVSQKYGKGQMGSESLWYIDVPNKPFVDDMGHVPSGFNNDTLKIYGVKAEPKLYRRVSSEESTKHQAFGLEGQTVEAGQDVKVPQPGGADKVSGEVGEGAGEAKEPTLDRAVQVRRTLVKPEVVNALPIEKRQRVLDLVNEYNGLNYVDASLVLPDQWARVSKRQQAKMQDTTSRVFAIENEVKQLIKPEAQIKREATEAELKQLDSRQNQLERHQSDLQSMFGRQLSSARPNKYKNTLALVENELTDIAKRRESISVTPTPVKGEEGAGKRYPLADPPEYSHSNYSEQGGVIARTTPDKFLSTVRKLDVDEVAQDNIDDLKRSIESGRKLDPAIIYLRDGQVFKHDGRHRAVAAKQLGISDFPVLYIDVDGKQVTPDMIRGAMSAPQVQERAKVEKPPTRYQQTGVRRKPSFDPETHDLTRFVIAEGGIRADRDKTNAGELARFNKLRPGLLNRSGKSVEEMARRAGEAGFNVGEGGGAVARQTMNLNAGAGESDPNVFLDKLEEDASGLRKHFTNQAEISRDELEELNPEERIAFENAQKFLADARVAKALKEIEHGREDAGIRDELYTIGPHYGLTDEGVDEHLEIARDAWSAGREGASEISPAENQGQANRPTLESLRPAEQPSMLPESGGLFTGETESAPQVRGRHPADVQREQLLGREAEKKTEKLRQTFGDATEALQELSRVSDAPVRKVASDLISQVGTIRQGVARDKAIALAKFADLRSKGQSVADYEHQGSMFGEQLSPEQMKHLREMSRSVGRESESGKIDLSFLSPVAQRLRKALGIKEPEPIEPSFRLRGKREQNEQAKPDVSYRVATPVDAGETSVSDGRAGRGNAQGVERVGQEDISPSATIRSRSFPKSAEEAGLNRGTNLIYGVVGDKPAIDRANRRIQVNGADRVAADIARSSEPSKDDIVAGQILARKYSESGDHEREVAVINDLAGKLTKAGQTVQAASLISRLSPEGVLLRGQKILNKRGANRTLTQEESTILKDSAGKVREAEAKISDLEKQIEEMRAGGQPTRGRQRLQTLEQRLAQAETDARTRLAARKQTTIRGGQAGASTIPLDIADYSIIGTSKLARRGISVAKWTDEMVSEFGEEIRPHLRKIYQASYQALRDERAKMRAESQERIVRRENPSVTDSAEIRKLIARRVDTQTEARNARQELSRTYESLGRSPLKRGLDGALNTLGLSRALTTLAPFHAAFKHTKAAIVPHPIVYAKSFIKQVEALNSAQYERFVSEVQLDSRYKYAQKFGLGLTGDFGGKTDLAGMEEATQSNWIHKIPGIKHSGQAFNTMVNVTRFGWFKQYMKYCEKLGYDPENSADARVFKQGAELVNNATGRGSLPGSLDSATPALNNAFFSTRLWASRLKMASLPFDPRSYLPERAGGLSRPAKVEAWKTLFGLTGLVGTQMYLAHLAGAKVSFNRDDDNFLQASWGRFHWDATAGMGTNIKYALKLAEAIRGNEKQKFGDILQNYIVNHLAPIPSGLYDIAQGKDRGGRPVYAWGRPSSGAVGRVRSSRVAGMFWPMSFEDAKTGYEQSSLGEDVLSGLGKAFGEGTEVYAPRASRGGGPFVRKLVKPSR